MKPNVDAIDKAISEAGYNSRRMFCIANDISPQCFNDRLHGRYSIGVELASRFAKGMERSVLDVLEMFYPEINFREVEK